MDEQDPRPAAGEPVPPETPEGTAAERPGRERTTFDQEPPAAEDPLLREEESAAAAEAAAIGGPAPDVGESDPALRPLEEAGQGVAEGFEQSERELVEQAEHGENRWSPETDAFSPEQESDRSTAVYGEPDEVDPTEVVSDPREGPDDPGAGTPIAPDR